MNEVNLEYWVRGGTGFASERIPWTTSLTDEEMSIYKNAIENKIPLEDIKELQPALWRVYDDIVAYEKECAEEWGDEFDGDIGLAFVDPLYK